MSPTFYISDFDTETTLSVTGEFLDAPVEPGWDVQIDCNCGCDFFSSTYNMIYDGSVNPLTDQEFQGRNVQYVTDEENLSELFMQIFQSNKDVPEAGNFFNLRIRTHDDSGKAQTGTRGKNSDEDSSKRRTGTGDGEGELDFEKARGASVGFDFLRYMSYRLFRIDYGILFENNIEVQNNIETNFLYSLKWAILNGSIVGDLASLKSDIDSTYNLLTHPENDSDPYENMELANLKEWMIEQTSGLSGEFIDWLPRVTEKQASWANRKVYRKPARSGKDYTENELWINRGALRGSQGPGKQYARVLYDSPASKTLFSSIAKNNPERFGNLGSSPDAEHDALWTMDALWDGDSNVVDGYPSPGPATPVYEQRSKTRIGAPLLGGDQIVMHIKVKMRDDQVSSIFGNTHEIDNSRVYRIVFHLQDFTETSTYKGREGNDWPY